MFKQRSILWLLLVVACGSSKQAQPDTTPSGGSGAGGDAGSAGSGMSSAGTGGDASGGSGGGSAGAAGSGGAGGADPCVSPVGCYTCAPTTNAQFLNACVGDGTCEASYDNSLVPALVANNGIKPPLP